MQNASPHDSARIAGTEIDKPEDISQEIWKQAEDLFMELRDAGGHDIPVIARAILKAKEDERETCAKLIGGYFAGTNTYSNAIRSRSKPTQC